ncbi:unnamed protein product [Durusdinium trenchii]|uniref:Uncharacterized protein n=2 Tax=Durusdinium trenchii TaxID=1381693 RepID=A0ABP0L6E8_9DINO
MERPSSSSSCIRSRNARCIGRDGLAGGRFSMSKLELLRVNLDVLVNGVGSGSSSSTGLTPSDACGVALLQKQLPSQEKRSQAARYPASPEGRRPCFSCDDGDRTITFDILKFEVKLSLLGRWRPSICWTHMSQLHLRTVDLGLAGLFLQGLSRIRWTCCEGAEQIRGHA